MSMPAVIWRRVTRKELAGYLMRSHKIRAWIADP
jgi:hypothetical protein